MKKSLFSALFLSFAINASEYIKDSKKATKQRARILAQISPITKSTQYKEYCTQVNILNFDQHIPGHLSREDIYRMEALTTRIREYNQQFSK